jgi:flavin-binding protein dodecin
MSIAKIEEIVGTFDKGWEDAAQISVNEAVKTIRGIHGIDIVDQTAQVDPYTGKITQYRTGINFHSV